VPNKYHISIQVISTADDDGANAASVTASQITSRLATVNQVFAPADVEFVFDETDDFLKINSTLLNRDFTLLEPPNLEGDKWDHEPLVDVESHNEAREELAKQYPHKLVLLFHNRKKLAKDPDTGHWQVVSKGGGSSGWAARYVNMSTSSGANDLAHEIGHYLQIPHPFVSGVGTVAEAATRIKDYVEGGHPKSQGLDALDGDRDWVLDTPADVAGSIFEAEGLEVCGDVGEISIPVTFADQSKKTYTLAPDRSLVMSYFKGCPGPKTISPQQARRVRDGLELRLRDALIGTKPSFSQTLSRGATGQAGAISEVDVALVRAGRIATAVRDGSGDLKVIVWDIGGSGETVTRRGSGVAGAIAKVAICSVGLDMVATAVIDGGGELKVILWRVEPNGDVTRLESATAGGQITDVAVSFLTRNHLATASRRANGTLRVDVWKVNAEGGIAHKASGTAGKVNTPVSGLNTPRLAMTDIGLTSVATFLRTEDKDLKTILWRYEDGVLSRLGDTNLGESPIGSIAGCRPAREIAVAAIQDENKNLQLVAYGFPEDGAFVEQRAKASAGQVGDVGMCRLGTEMVVTAVRAGSGNMKVILWQVTNTGHHLVRLDDATTDEPFSRLAICYTGRNEFATALRDTGGNLRVIAWRVLGSIVTELDKDIFQKLLDRALRPADVIGTLKPGQLVGALTSADRAVAGECEADGSSKDKQTV
jgi:hypothetical protein